MQIPFQLAQPDLGWDPSWWPTQSSEGWLNLASYLLIAVGAMALLWGGAIVAGRIVRWIWPVRVFVAVARAMGLRYGECWRLWRLARAQQLGSPLTLLMSPETLKFHAEEHAGRHPQSHRLRKRYNILRRRLFERRSAPGA